MILYYLQNLLKNDVTDPNYILLINLERIFGSFLVFFEKFFLLLSFLFDQYLQKLMKTIFHSQKENHHLLLITI